MKVDKGWAVIDATPQEPSNVIDSPETKLMQCGPAPVAAIKKGRIDIGYDTGFVFAEINADRVKWIAERGRNIESLRYLGCVQ